MSTRELLLRRRTAASALNARIGVVAIIVVAQFWALVATLDAWLGRDTASLPGILLFQGACAGATLVVRRVGRRRE